jgi:hypothetical protein
LNHAGGTDIECVGVTTGLRVARAVRPMDDACAKIDAWRENITRGDLAYRLAD